MSKNVAVFVDVANIFYAAKAAGVDIDYVTLLKSATAGRDFVRAYAYTGLDPDNENQKNFHSFLARHGYKVVSKDIRKYGDGKVKANLDIELVVDMMKTARNLDVAVIVSGDGDFAPAIRAVQEMGVRVEVISFRGNTSSDLIEVADLFTDIGQIARVEKGSTRSGRRVAGDEEDLSMTEVPEKQSEGRGELRRRRGRGRDREETPAVAASSGSRSLVALPGERLSRAGAGAEAPSDEETPEAETAAAAAGGPAQGDEDAEGRRRRRRRGGRGRGRGRGREEAGLEAGTAPAVPAAPGVPYDEPEDVVELAPRGPRPTPFGSVWDTQLGTPSPRSPELTPFDEEEDLEEPAIPEYLLAEQRRGRDRGRSQGRGGRGRGGAYAAALDRERYGGGRGQGVSRYAEPRGGRAQGGRPEQRPPRSERPERTEAPRGGGGRSSEPWSEVPPELEELLRAQMARARDAAPAGAPAAEAAAEAAGTKATGAEAPAPKRRTTRRTAKAADALEVAPEAGEPADDAGSAETAAPKRRTTRRTSRTEAPPPASVTADAEAEAPAPKRRPTRKAAAAAEPAEAAETAAAPDAPAPKRRTTRKAAAAAEPAESSTDDAPAPAPRRRTRKASEPAEG